MQISKSIVYNDRARKALEKGMSVLAKAVGITLGPKGRNIILSPSLGSPMLTNDGATIVKEVELSNHLENVGVSLLRQAALKTNDVAGDGTTTATVLAYAFVSEAMKAIGAGLNPILVKQGLEKAACFVISKLAEYSRPVQNIDDIVHIATVSAGYDTNAGFMIAEAIQKVGREGTISLEEGCSSQTFVEIAEGMSIDQGFMSEHFLLQSDEVEIRQKSPLVLLTDQEITCAQQELVSLIEDLASAGRSLLIIAKDLSKEVLAMLIANRLKGIIDVVAVRAPGFGSTSRQILEDLAVLTGGQLLSSNYGLGLSDLSSDLLGSADQIIISKSSTKIMSSAHQSCVNMRCRQISKQIDLSTNSYEKEKLRNRLSSLQARIAVIIVGASTETEIRYKKLRLEDAINAAKAAIDEGILPGGGATLLHLAKKLDVWPDKAFFSPEELAGIQIVSRSLTTPLALIAENAGLASQTIVEKLKTEDFPMGYDVKKNLVVDMYQTGILDPAKVTRSAIQNSISVASIILTTECVIGDSLT